MLAEQEGAFWLKEQEVPFLAIDMNGHQISYL
jgi:hypothetical protein